MFFKITLVLPRPLTETKIYSWKGLKKPATSLINTHLKYKAQINEMDTFWEHLPYTFSTLKNPTKLYVDIKEWQEAVSEKEQDWVPPLLGIILNPLNTGGQWQKTTIPTHWREPKQKVNHNSPEEPASQFWAVPHLPCRCHPLSPHPLPCLAYPRILN